MYTNPTLTSAAEGFAPDPESAFPIAKADTARPKAKASTTSFFIIFPPKFDISDRKKVAEKGDKINGSQ
jgi:hypothetical protein